MTVCRLAISPSSSDTVSLYVCDHVSADHSHGSESPQTEIHKTESRKKEEVDPESSGCSP